MSNIVAVVGIGPGVGMAVARRFGKEGFVIAGIARTPEKLVANVAELREAGLAAHAFPADAGDIDSLQAAFQDIETQLGAVDVLIYNASLLSEGPPSALDPQRVLAEWRVNTLGALVAVQAVLPAMQAADTGTILFTGGGLALNPYFQYASLAMGKASLRNLAYSLAGELEATGVFVGTVTIAGNVAYGTHFDPDLIAERYWEQHTQRHETEIIYR